MIRLSSLNLVHQHVRSSEAQVKRDEAAALKRISKLALDYSSHKVTATIADGWCPFRVASISSQSHDGHLIALLAKTREILTSKLLNFARDGFLEGRDATQEFLDKNRGITPPDNAECYTGYHPPRNVPLQHEFADTPCRFLRGVIELQM